jgi:hypothetical protein
LSKILVESKQAIFKVSLKLSGAAIRICGSAELKPEPKKIVFAEARTEKIVSP